MREANERGRAAGYGAYEQSVELDRDADRVQFDVSHRDLELEFTHQPDQALAQRRAEGRYAPPRQNLPRALNRLTYDQYRAIRFRPEEALWHGEALFEIQLFHPGYQ